MLSVCTFPGPSMTMALSASATCSRMACLRCSSSSLSRMAPRITRKIPPIVQRTWLCESRTRHSLRESQAHDFVRLFSSSRPSMSSKITVLNKEYDSDDYTNLTPSIASRLTLTPQLPLTPSHPLQLVCRQIQRSLSDFDVVEPPSPIVTVEENFGSLGFPEDHPGRSPTDTYYINRQTCLRTHTSTHEVDTFAKGHAKWLLTADVFRRDEIDASHYPVFHQMEGACIYELSEYDEERGRVLRECRKMEERLGQAQIEIEDNVDLQEAGGYQDKHAQDPRKRKAAQLAMRHLKATLNNLVLDLFGERHAANVKAHTSDALEPLKVRWIAASFPFTSPSFEIEVLFGGKWLEILGCGVVMEKTLDNAKVNDKLGWAFGLGLERIAMVLFQIPDIRLFWSKDPRFMAQFAVPHADANAEREQTGVSPAGGATVPKNVSSASKLPLITFKAYSRYPACYKDVSFWLPGEGQKSSVHENDVFEVIRDVAGDLTEDVSLIDDFTHPKTGRRSKCFRINYRSMDRNLENEEVNGLHDKVTDRLVNDLHVVLR